MRYVRYQPRGFTLLEILIVLGIIGMLAAILVPRAMSGTDHYTMGRNIREVASALRMTRSLAIETQKEQVIQFNLSQQTYQIPKEKARHIDENLDLEVFTAQSELSEDQQIAGIRFYPDGASTGGRVTLILDDDKRAVDIVWMTGQINVLEEVRDD